MEGAPRTDLGSHRLAARRRTFSFISSSAPCYFSLRSSSLTRSTQLQVQATSASSPRLDSGHKRSSWLSRGWRRSAHSGALSRSVLPSCYLCTRVNADLQPQHLEPPAVFLVVGLKDFLLPYLFSIIFGNPLPSKRISGSALSQVKQMLALMVLGVYRVLDRWPQLMGTSEQGEGRTKAG